MCLILFAYNRHKTYRLILAANRDEFYDRPSAPLMYWKDHPHVLAGRDLKSMGTWMGISRTGRFAAITNYREPGVQKMDAPSRGHLISDYLAGGASPSGYLEKIRPHAGDYNGFNLLIGDSDALYHYSNRGADPTRLESGIYGLSNRLLDTNWPKVHRGKRELAASIGQDRRISRKSILNLLQSQHLPPDDQLPDTGVGLDWERTLSPIFITSPDYGTRCSTLLTIDRSDRVQVTELTWRPAHPRPTLQAETSFDFMVESSEGL